jgi:hypothetical protein
MVVAHIFVGIFVGLLAGGTAMLADFSLWAVILVSMTGGSLGTALIAPSNAARPPRDCR